MTNNRGPERVIHFGFADVGFQRTGLVPREDFVWIKPLRRLTLGDVRYLLRFWRLLRSDSRLFINVDATDPVAMRFARYFNFIETGRVGAISVQIWGGHKCKP